MQRGCCRRSAVNRSTADAAETVSWNVGVRPAICLAGNLNNVFVCAGRNVDPNANPRPHDNSACEALRQVAVVGEGVKVNEVRFE
jgi:hypothetical protein